MPRLIPVLLVLSSALGAGVSAALGAHCEDERAVTEQLRGREAEATALIASAPAHGLDPVDYPPDALADSVLRLIADVHFGRVDASPYGHGRDAEERSRELAELAADALSAPSLGEALGRVEPRLHQYRSVRTALARYRLLAARAPSPPALPAHTIHPGDELETAAELRRYLALLGDLSERVAGADAGAHLDDALAEGLRRFQGRHGLEPDGVIGRRTRAALAVPLARRVEQLELALERLRWLPTPPTGRWIVVNIPAYRLIAFSSGVRDDAPALVMKVIVGEAVETATPLLSAPMRYVEFRPYWNVPMSIVSDELLPALREDPTHLARQRMELVRDTGEAVAGEEVTPDMLAELELRGGAWIRQQPGPGNALGLVKFGLPNDEAIFLHDTPSRGAFARERRDLSHGCIRVADPVALAELVLDGQSDVPWTRPRIEAAMQAEEPLRVELRRTIPVVLYYSTAVVLPDGRVAFFEDVYGHDAELERALEAHQLRTRPVSRCTKSEDG